MKGLSLRGAIKNYPLIPIYLCIGVGGLGAGLYVLRLALYSPDVSWKNKKEAEPWNYYKDKQYKFYRTENMPDSQMKSPAPEY